MNVSDFERDEIWAFAQLLKRIDHNSIRANAVDDNEAALMKSAVFKMQKLLSDLGYDPR